ncbi:MAG TPA: metal ABC transporter substrate-binding protein, partial [Gaiellales bacterium]|nr:metal ABC transporter substrate-binding protein [Gaiellales bacterium]
MPRIRLLTLLALCLLPLGCTTTHIASSTPGQITVVATTTQMQDLVRHVGGDKVHLVGILRPNVDPHDFEPSPSTAIALTAAKLIVESGVGVDSWVDGLVANAVPGTPVWVASQGLPLRTGDSSEPDGDPHWWHDPTLFERAATALGERLATIDPPHADAYRAAARGYLTRIRAMDAANMRLIATVPRGERKLVTNHDAFGYFAAHYGIRVAGSVIPSLSTEAQASASDVASLILRIRQEHVTAIFTETSLSPKLEEQIASEAGVKVYANLYGDTLGPAGSPGATYLGMERWDMQA